MAVKPEFNKNFSVGASFHDVPVYEEIAVNNKAGDSNYSAINMSTMNRGSIYTGAVNISSSGGARRGSKSRKSIALLVIIASVVSILLLSGCCGVLFLEVHDLKSKTSSFEQAISQLINEKQGEKKQVGLRNIVESLSDLEHKIQEPNTPRNLSVYNIEDKLSALAWCPI